MVGLGGGIGLGWGALFQLGEGFVEVGVFQAIDWVVISHKRRTAV